MTGWSIMSQLRPNVSDGLINGIEWYCSADGACGIHCPYYPQITRIPEAVSKNHQNMWLFNWDTQHWVSKLLENLAQYDYEHVHPLIEAKREELLEYYQHSITIADNTAIELAQRDRSVAVEYLTQMAQVWTDKLMSEQQNLFETLFRTFFDGVKHEPVEGSDIPDTTDLPHRDLWYSLIAGELPQNEVVESSSSSYRTNSGRTRKIDPLSQLKYACK